MSMVSEKMASGLQEVLKVAKAHTSTRPSVFSPETAEIDLESSEWGDETPKQEYEACLAAASGPPTEKPPTFVEALQQGWIGKIEVKICLI